MKIGLKQQYLRSDLRSPAIYDEVIHEIELIKKDWSLSELKRQFDTSLFERLSLSKNKAEVEQVSKQGQIIQKPSDLIKDPYVIEFLGLEEMPKYSESDLENKIIDIIEKFLLEC